MNWAQDFLTSWEVTAAPWPLGSSVPPFPPGRPQRGRSSPTHRHRAKPAPRTQSCLLNQGQGDSLGYGWCYFKHLGTEIPECERGGLAVPPSALWPRPPSFLPVSVGKPGGEPRLHGYCCRHGLQLPAAPSRPPDPARWSWARPTAGRVS